MWAPFAAVENFLPLQHLLEMGNRFAQALILRHPFVDQPTGMQDGAVVAPTEAFADVHQRPIGQRAAQEHGDLSREGDVLGAAMARHVG
jgi:hypothetical protein